MKSDTPLRPVKPSGNMDLLRTLINDCPTGSDRFEVTPDAAKAFLETLVSMATAMQGVSLDVRFSMGKASI